MSIDINCDVSKCESKSLSVRGEYQAGEGWNRVQMYTINRGTKVFHICPECSQKFGIEVINASSDPGQQLLDLIYEIVQEEISNSRE